MKPRRRSLDTRFNTPCMADTKALAMVPVTSLATPTHLTTRSQAFCQRQQGAALLMAMLTVALVAVLASTAMWQQWRTL